MSKNLARIKVKSIDINMAIALPTVWDGCVVQSDLNSYVAQTRIVKGTPLVRIIDKRFIAINGIPFLKAAEIVTPPIEEIVCIVEGSELDIRALGALPVKVSDLLQSECERYLATEILCFQMPLVSSQRMAVDEKVRGFFDLVTSNPEQYGGNYGDFSGLTWNADTNAVMWTWLRRDTEGVHLLLFRDVLRDIENSVAVLRSYNGFKILLA